MKDEILEIINKLEKIWNNYDYINVETAIYLFMRFSTEDIKEVSESTIEKICEIIEYKDGSLFNEDINEEAENIILESEE